MRKHLFRVIIWGLFVALGLPVFLGVSAVAQPQGTDVAAPAAQAAPPLVLRVDWFAELAKGGFTTIVQLLLGVAMVAITIERFWSVRRDSICPPRFLKRIRDLWPGGQFRKLDTACQADGSTLSLVIQHMLRHRKVPLEVLTIGAGDVAARELKRHMQRAYPLVVIATLEPLLGLLGTIIGMVEAFNKVAALGDTGDASMLADSIGKALITTALGLILAIPALGLYHYFRQRISLLGTVLEEQVEELFSYWIMGVDSTEEIRDRDHTP